MAGPQLAPAGSVWRRKIALWSSPSVNSEVTPPWPSSLSGTLAASPRRRLEELKQAPSVLRLSYLADVEREGLVRERLKALKKEIARQWDRAGGGYQLSIETEVFWRRGGPR